MKNLKDMKQIWKPVLLSTSLVLFTACGGGGSSSDPEPELTSITHNGTIYGFVTSPATGRVWLDRNLGAARVCESRTDVACYGDYYQWGRNTDGHEDSNSGTTSVLSANVNDAGHTDFITTSSSPWDWASVDRGGNGRSANWAKTDGSSICPVGFSVPTADEFSAELVVISNRDEAFTSFLKLPTAGYRGFNASLYSEDSFGYIHTTSVSSNPILSISLVTGSNANLSPAFMVHALGQSVRCIKH